jgi:hypothetical protein
MKDDGIFAITIQELAVDLGIEAGRRKGDNG